MPRVLVPLAEGFEEIETSTIVDVLRRAAVEVVVAGIAGPEPVLGARGMRFVPDVAWSEIDEDGFDLVVLPGGAQGSENLAADGRLRHLIRDRVAKEQPVAAICAAPFALDQAGVLRASAFTCYPGWEARIGVPGRRHEAVVDAGTVITSQGPGTAMEFALHLVMRLRGAAVAQEIGRGLLFGPR